MTLLFMEKKLKKTIGKKTILKRFLSRKWMKTFKISMKLKLEYMADLLNTFRFQILSFQTDNALKGYGHGGSCKGHGYCRVGVPSGGDGVSGYNHGEGSLKAPWVIYADFECLPNNNHVKIIPMILILTEKLFVKLVAIH